MEKIFSASYRKAAVMIAPDQIVILNIVKRLFIQELYFLLRSEGQKNGIAVSLSQFLLMSVLSQSFFTLVCCHFMSLSFLTTWHSS